MMEDDIVITGLGMASSLHGVVTACAAARAGIVRPRELESFTDVDEDTVELAPTFGHPHPYCTEGFQGAARLARLGEAALADLLEYSGLQRGELAKSAFFLNLGSSYLSATSTQDPATHNGPPRSTPTTTGLNEAGPALESVLTLVMRTSGLNFPQQYRAIRGGDHYGSIQAVQEASRLLRTRAVERCLVGGIDCLLTRDQLETLSELRLLKTANSPAGLMPGEAAAFFLLELRTSARRRGARMEAIMGPTFHAREEQHRFSGQPSTGLALSEVMEHAQATLGPEKAGLMIHNLNGDPWRSMEWGSALVRLTPRHSVREVPVWVPAESFGETGAATAAIGVCMGTRAFARSHAGTRHILVAMSSYDGNKACLVLKDARLPGA